MCVSHYMSHAYPQIHIGVCVCVCVCVCVFVCVRVQALMFTVYGMARLWSGQGGWLEEQCPRTLIDIRKAMYLFCRVPLEVQGPRICCVLDLLRLQHIVTGFGVCAAGTMGQCAMPRALSSSSCMARMAWTGHPLSRRSWTICG